MYINSLNKLISLVVGVITKTLLKSQENGKDFFNVIVFMGDGTSNISKDIYIELGTLLKQLFPDKLNKCLILDPPKIFYSVLSILKHLDLFDKKTSDKVSLLSTGNSNKI